MEKKDVVTCPACSVENPKNRATCQVCHEPLYKKVEKMKEKDEKAKVNLKTPPPPPPPGVPPNPFKDKSSAIPLETSKRPIRTPAEKIAKVPAKRKPRRKSRTVPESQYFILQGQSLLPVEITQHVKVLKKKAVKAEARMVIDLWNRNKGLLAK